MKELSAESSCLDRAKMPRQGLLEIGQRPAIWSRRGQRLAMGRRFRQEMAKAKKWQKQGPGFVGSHRLTRHPIFLRVTALAVALADAPRGPTLGPGTH